MERAGWVPFGSPKNWPGQKVGDARKGENYPKIDQPYPRQLRENIFVEYLSNMWYLGMKNMKWVTVKAENLHLGKSDHVL